MGVCRSSFAAFNAHDPYNTVICGVVLSTTFFHAVPLQAWSAPEGPSKLRFPDFMITAQEGGKVVSLMHRPHLPPGNVPGTHFC